MAALGCAIATFKPVFRTAAGRKIRISLYSLLGASAFYSAYDGVRIYGWHSYNQRMGLFDFTAMAIIQVSGAGIYGLRIPERWYPKTFDIVGASHQIMHVMVMIGALVYAAGIIRAFDYWHGIKQGHINSLRP